MHEDANMRRRTKTQAWLKHVNANVEKGGILLIKRKHAWTLLFKRWVEYV